MSALTFTAFVLLAFAIGYFVVSKLIDGIRGPARSDSNPTEGARAAAYQSESTAGNRTISHPQTYEDPETRYARVLALRLPVTAPEIRDRYRALIAQYHPDKVSHLGPELREVAERKTRELLEAYEYFRVKYRL